MVDLKRYTRHQLTHPNFGTKMKTYLKNKKYSTDEIAIILKSISDYDSLFLPQENYPHIKAQIAALFVQSNKSTKPLVKKLLTNQSNSKIDTNKILLKKAIVMLTRSTLI